MPANEPWTIDSIAHALPHPVTRQRFLAEINLAPVADLPGLLSKWVGVAEDWAAAHPRIEALRAHYEAHGTLPEGYQAALVDSTDEVIRQGRRGRGAA